eukprot:COSAG06_NODE_60128_length_272_cov_0.554913_1_plen_81_part_10
MLPKAALPFRSVPLALLLLLLLLLLLPPPPPPPPVCILIQFVWAGAVAVSIRAAGLCGIGGWRMVRQSVAGAGGPGGLTS